MKLSTAFTFLSALLAVQAMERAPTGAHHTSDILFKCYQYMYDSNYVWSEVQLRMCIKAAADTNSANTLEELLDVHLQSVEHMNKIQDVTRILPSLIVACSVDNRVDALRVLLEYHRMDTKTLKAAFIRAAASGASRAVESSPTRLQRYLLLSELKQSSRLISPKTTTCVAAC